MTIKYTIVEAFSVTECIKRVNQHIANGWAPLGGVGHNENHNYFYQAMIQRVFDEEISIE